eukprot:104647-Prorocentrum_minimum.AAC.1
MRGGMLHRHAPSPAYAPPRPSTQRRRLAPYVARSLRASLQLASQTDRQADRQADRQIDRRTARSLGCTELISSHNRQTHRQTDSSQPVVALSSLAHISSHHRQTDR